MSLHSSLYVGSVMHRRLRPRRHHFRYRSFWLLLDLDELSALSARLRWFSYNRPNLFSLHDSDHGDGSATPLRTQIAQQLAAADIDLGGGRISLLCMPRTFGHCFNPLSLFFCYRADGALAAIIYQVHNTFAQRHSYIIPVTDAGDTVHQRCRKLFYVSPFMDMDLRYQFRIVGPNERIAVGICAMSGRTPVLNAALAGDRHPLSDRSLLRVGLRMPAITLKVMAAIHWEALKLFVKRIGLRRRPPPPLQAATIVAPHSRDVSYPVAAVAYGPFKEHRSRLRQPKS
jgi:uncharacterized protein